MKQFLVVIKTEWNDIICVKVKADTRTQLYNSDKSPSDFLFNKIIRDTYVFGGFNHDQVSYCKVIYVEELENILEIK